MKLHQALDIVITIFDINVADLARDTGVAPSSISQFRKGKRNLSANHLDTLVNALPTEATEMFYSLCSTKDVSNIEPLVGKHFLQSRGVCLV